MDFPILADTDNWYTTNSTISLKNAIQKFLGKKEIRIGIDL